MLAPVEGDGGQADSCIMAALCGRGCNGTAQLCVKCYMTIEERGSKRILWEKHYLSWPLRVE